MNNLLFIAIVIVLLYYFCYYLPQQKKLSPDPDNQPLTQSISTQTDLSDKQVSLLTQQWNQVAQWAKECEIDINKSWNLAVLKKHLNKEKELLEKANQTLSEQNISLKDKNTLLTQQIKEINHLIYNLQDLENWLNQDESRKQELHQWEAVIKGLKTIQNQKEQFKIDNVLEWFMSNDLEERLKNDNRVANQLEAFIQFYWSNQENAIFSETIEKYREVVKTWMESELSKMLKDNKVVVYKSWTGAKKVPVEETIEAKKYQELLNHLGVNTLGINEPIRTFATYEEVISAITEFKERVITNADNHYQQKIDCEVSLKSKLASKLERVKELVNNDEIEQLKELVRKGEI